MLKEFMVIELGCMVKKKMVKWCPTYDTSSHLVLALRHWLRRVAW